MTCDVFVKFPRFVSKFCFGGRFHRGDGRVVPCVMAFLWSLDAVAQDLTNLLPPIRMMLLLSKSSTEKNLITYITIKNNRDYIKHSIISWLLMGTFVKQCPHLLNFSQFTFITVFFKFSFNASCTKSENLNINQNIFKKIFKLNRLQNIITQTSLLKVSLKKTTHTRSKFSG